MSIAIEDLVWSVTGIKTKDIVSVENTNLADAVVQTYWKVEYTDAAGNTANFSGATPLDVSEMTDQEFVNLADLTEDIVVSWIKEHVVDSYLDHVLGRLQKQLEEQIVNEPTLPWAPTPE